MNSNIIVSALNLVFIIVPLSVVAIEYYRTRKSVEIITFSTVFSLGLLELFTNFVFKFDIDKTSYAIYKICVGLLLVFMCWVIFADEKDINKKKFKFYAKVNLIIPFLTIFVLWLSWKNVVNTGSSGVAFTVWQLAVIPILGWAVIKVGKTNRTVIFLTLFFWVLGFSVSDFFLPVFYALFAYLVLYKRVKNILDVDSFKKQLLKEKETIFRLINDIGTSVRDIRTSDETLNLILSSAIEAIHADAGAIYIYEKSSLSNRKILNARVVKGPFTPLHASSIYGNSQTFTDADAKDIDKDVIRERELKIGERIIGSVLEEGKTVIVEDARNDERIIKLGGSALNIHTLIASPIKIKDDLLGVIICINRKDGKTFTGDDGSVLQTLGDQAALSVNNAKLYSGLTEQERMQRELEIAKEIQIRLLPDTIPTVNGIAVSTVMRTAREVGGDYYDCIKFNDDKMAIVIGDVAGKGVPAGMIVLIIRTVLHILAKEHVSTSDLLIGLSNRVYSQMESREFMTLLYLFWDNTQKVMRYASAGHEHILHYVHKTGKIRRIKSGGIAIGMHDDMAQFVSEKEIKVDKGDTIVLYTDGITEARSKSGDMYGLDRLQEKMSECCEKSPEEQKQIIIKDINEFTAGCEQYDDITMIVCKFV